MKRFFLLKLAIGAGIALAAYVLIAGSIFGLSRLVGGDMDIATYPAIIQFFGGAAALFVTLAFLVTYMPPNLAWLTSLPASKTRIWAWNYLTSIAVLLGLTATVAAIAGTVGHWFPGRHSFDEWIGLRKSFVALAELIVYPTTKRPSEAVMALSYLGVLHFIAGMIDMKPSRSARRAVIWIIFWSAFLVLVALATNSGSLGTLGALLALLCLQAGHSRARLELGWSQFRRIGFYLAAVFLVLGILPVLGAWRSLGSQTVDVVRDAQAFTGKVVAQVDRRHLLHLMHQNQPRDWDFSWLFMEVFGETYLDPRHAELDFPAMVAAQTHVQTLAAMALILAPTASIADYELILDKAQGATAETSDPNFRLAAALPELTGAAQAIDLWLGDGMRPAASGYKLSAAILAARYFPSSARLKRLVALWPDLEPTQRPLTLATLSILAGRPLTEREVEAPTLSPDWIVGARCEALDRQEACRLFATCERAPQSLSCLIRGLGSTAVLNSCLRAKPRDLAAASSNARRRYARTDVETQGWIEASDNIVSIHSLATVFGCADVTF